MDSSVPWDSSVTLTHFDLAPDGVVLVDHEGRVRYANDMAARLIGVGLDDLRGSPFGLPLTATAEVQLKGSDNSWHTTELRTHEVEVDGAPGSIVVLRDVSGRVARERALERAVSDRDQSLAVTSHELRGSLFAISLAVRTLRAQTGLPESERVASLDLIDRQARRMASLVTTFLEADRRSSPFEPRPSTTSLLEVVLATALQLGVGADDLRVSVPVDLLVEMSGEHLEVILHNLLSNAVKHGAAPFEVHAERRHGDIVLQVCDAGDGVPAPLVPTLFERFTRADGTALDGVGLGLWIARSLALAYGGDLAYVGVDGFERRHRPGPGAHFLARLPASRLEAEGEG